MVESIQLNMDKIQHQKSNDYQSSSYIQEIKCKLLEKTIINDKNIKVSLRNPKPMILIMIFQTLEINKSCKIIHSFCPKVKNFCMNGNILFVKFWAKSYL